MQNFFKKLRRKKTINLKCYCVEPQTNHLFPIQKAKDFVPDWFKNLPPYKEGVMPTTRVCPGIKDAHSKGIIVPLWSDLKIYYDQDGKIEVTSPLNTHNKQAEVHNPEQWGRQYKGWQHVKILSPWFIECDEAVPFMMLEPFWFRNDVPEYRIAPGVLEFKYQHACHGQVFLPPTKEPKVIAMEGSVPFAHLVPLEDVDINIEICELDQASFNRVVHKSHWTWGNIYYKTKKVMERLEKNK